MPASSSASTSPATSGASGPTTTRSIPSSLAAATSPSTVSAPMLTLRASSAMPALPGAQNRSGSLGERASARMIACSRPPPPTTSTFMPRALRRSKRARELLGGNRGQRLAAHRSARAELDRDLRHRLLVGSLDDGYEVVLAQGGPLLLDLDPELLHLLVDLLDPARVVLQGLNP